MSALHEYQQIRKAKKNVPKSHSVHPHVLSLSAWRVVAEAVQGPPCSTP